MADAIAYKGRIFYSGINGGGGGGGDANVTDIDYDDFEELTPEQLMDGTVRFVYDGPDAVCTYSAVTKTLTYNWNALYVPENKTLIIK